MYSWSDKCQSSFKKLYIITPVFMNLLRLIFYNMIMT